MSLSSQRVAFRFLTADSTMRNVDNLLQSVQKYRDDLARQHDTMGILIAKGEARRLGRTSDIIVGEVDADRDGQGNVTRVSAVIHGTTATYKTHISLFPKRGHHCTCPDWEKNGVRVGPCKHVLRLGQHWQEWVAQEIDALEDRLTGILEHSV